MGTDTFASLLLGIRGKLRVRREKEREREGENANKGGYCD